MFPAERKYFLPHKKLSLFKIMWYNIQNNSALEEEMICVFVVALAILFSMLRFVPRRGKWAVGVAVATSLFCASGALLCGIAIQDARAVLQAGMPDVSTAEWAYDTMRAWFYLAGVSCAAVGVPLLLASLIRHRMAWMRTVIAPCASLVTGLAAAGYTVLCENPSIDFTAVIYTFAAGCAALLLCGVAADAIRYAAGQDVLRLPKIDHAPQKRR